MLLIRFRSRPFVLFEFVHPALSPVYKALIMASDLVLPAAADKEWLAVRHFSALPWKAMIQKIWASLLPAAARLWWRLCLEAVESFPLQFALLHSRDNELKSQVIQNFVRKPRCCIPAGLRRLHEAVDGQPEMFERPWLQKVIRNVLSQIDLGTMDIEILHSEVRSSLYQAQGRSVSLAAISLRHMYRQIGSHWRRLQRPEKMPRVQKRQTKKRNRFDAWNSFVRENAPRGTGQARQASVASGEHLKGLALRWKALSSDQRRPFEDLARAERARLATTAPCSSAEPAGSPDTDRLTPWGLGDAEGPFRADIAGLPVYSEKVCKDVSGWVKSLDEEVTHELRLPKTVRYSCVCSAGCCALAAHKSLADQLLTSFRKRNYPLLTPLLIRADMRTCGQRTESEVHPVLVAHRFGSRPAHVIFLILEPQHPTTASHIEDGAQLPWMMSFKRKSRSFDELRTLHFMKGDDFLRRLRSWFCQQKEPSLYTSCCVLCHRTWTHYASRRSGRKPSCIPMCWRTWQPSARSLRMRSPTTPWMTSAC